MRTLIIIIVVVVVGDDDTDDWVYLSSNHLFQVYYKVRQVLLQSATGITKCDDYYKVRQYMARPVLSFGNRPDELLTLIDPHIKHAILSSVKQQIIVRIMKYVRSNK